MVGGIIVGEDTFSISVVVPPLAFIGGSILPDKLALAMFHIIYHLSFVDLAVLLEEPCDAVAEVLHLGLVVDLLRQQFERFVAGA